MSMEFSVYVGPYLKVTGVDRRCIEPFEHILRDGRMEAGVDDEDLYLIPNCHVVGIERQVEFDRHSDLPVVPIYDIISEKRDFASLCQPFVDALPEKSSALLQWGLVPCWS